MDPETIEKIIILVLAGLVVTMGLWYLAVRLNQPRIKMFAVMFGGFPLLAAGITLSDYFLTGAIRPTRSRLTRPGRLRTRLPSRAIFPFPSPIQTTSTK